jgi:methionine biosynthesis protein MetW
MSSQEPNAPKLDRSQIAAYYDAYWHFKGRPVIPTPPPEVIRIMRREIAAGSACLDVGCGNGRAGGLPLRAIGCRYIGVDVSPAAIDAARKIGLDARQINDAADLPFSDASFDAVIAMEVLEHLVLPKPAVLEMMRVLKPGGVLLATSPNVAYWRRRLELVVGRWNPLGHPDAAARPWADPHLRFFTVGTLRQLLREAGFHEIQVGGHGGHLLGDIPRIGKLLRKAEGSRAYRLLEHWRPSTFGCFLNAVARKPR